MVTVGVPSPGVRFRCHREWGCTRCRVYHSESAPSPRSRLTHSLDSHTDTRAFQRATHVAVVRHGLGRDRDSVYCARSVATSAIFPQSA